MEQKAILRLIIKEAKFLAIDKKNIEKKEKQLSVDAKEIKDKLAKAKDIKEKDEALYEEKVAEVRELAAERKESYKKVQKEKLKLKDKIKKSKERIIAKLKENQKEIFENRHKFEKISSEDIKKLKQERMKLRKELTEIKELKDTPKEKLKEMSEEDREKVQEAKKKFKDSTKRIGEINEKLNIAKLFDGKKPQEMFKRNKVIIEKVEEAFNFDKISTLDSEISKIFDKNKETKEKKKDTQKKATEKPKQEQKPKEKSNSKLPQQEQQTGGEPVQQQVPRTEGKSAQQQVQQPYSNNPVYNNFPFMSYPMNNYFGNIGIFEKEGIATYNFGDQQGKISLKEVKKDKRAMFKKYGIRKLVGFRASRKVNPAVIKAFEQMENGEQMIGEYLQSIKYNQQFSFNLDHDISGLNFFKKISKNRQARCEEKCGATITRKQADVDYKHMIAESGEQSDIETQPKKRRQRTMDSYVKADAETLHRIEQVEVAARENIGKEVQEMVNENNEQEQGEEMTN